jgi:hypothetical protein
MGTGERALSLGVKRQGREADHSPKTSAEIKKIWILYIPSPIRLHGVVSAYLVEHKDNFPFYFFTLLHYRHCMGHVATGLRNCYICNYGLMSHTSVVRIMEAVLVLRLCDKVLFWTITTKFLSLHIDHSRAMVLGWTQPPTEMSTRYLPRGKGRPAPKADNLTVICESTV